MADTGRTEVTAGAPDPRCLDLGWLRVSHAVFPAGSRIPSHYHERACLSIVLRGRFLQRFPGREADCPPGGVLVKPPGERHIDRWFDADAHHVILEPDPERHDAFGPCAGLFGEIAFAVDPEAAELGHRIVRELERSDELSALAVEGMAYELAALMARRDGDESPSPPCWLAGVLDRMRDEYACELRLDDLARTAGVHPSYLARAFRRFYGRTVGEHLRSLRVRGAHRDLLGTDVPLSRVAVRNGFCDQSHLTRVLKRETGLTPGALRSASWADRGY